MFLDTEGSKGIRKGYLTISGLYFNMSAGPSSIFFIHNDYTNVNFIYNHPNRF